MDKEMKYIKRILLVILAPIFALTFPIDGLMFIGYYIATGKCYSDDYQPFMFALFEWVNEGCKKSSFNWKWEDVWEHLGI
jgi:hypothetical protein